MKKFQYTTIIATSLLYCWMLLGISCNKCSSKEETTVVTSETDTIYGPQTESASGSYDTEYDNAGSNASGEGSTSGAGTAGDNKNDPASTTKKDSVKKVPAGGSTAKEARFSSSGSN